MEGIIRPDVHLNKTKNHLVDTHTHITPNVDDGASSPEMSLEMLRSEAEQGGNVIFLTPHSSAFASSRLAARANENMRKVQKAAAEAGIPVRIYQGCEIYTYREIMELLLRDLEYKVLPSMNGTRYVLAEFDTDTGDLEDAKYSLQRYLKAGWIPIIAHAERYHKTFTSVSNIKELKELGCLVQVNLFDLDEEPDGRIRQCARDLLSEELVDLVGSDGHKTWHRPPALTGGREYIEKNCRKEYAEKVLTKNAESLLLGQR